MHVAAHERVDRCADLVNVDEAVVVKVGAVVGEVVGVDEAFDGDDISECITVPEWIPRRLPSAPLSP